MTEKHARDGAQAAVGDDEILDVAIVMPRGSTLASVLGTAAGVGLGGNNSAAWGVSGGMLAQRAHSASHGSYPSIVLALSQTKLYVLGRARTGVGGWKNLHTVAHIDRRSLAVARRRRGTVQVIELTDAATGTTLEFEKQNIGNLGINDLLAQLGEGAPKPSADTD